jgi:hypothetical protein
MVNEALTARETPPGLSTERGSAFTEGGGLSKWSHGDPARGWRGRVWSGNEGRVRKSTAVLGAVLGGITLFVAGLGIGWTVGQKAAFYDCMERIRYDPALRHLCE